MSLAHRARAHRVACRIAALAAGWLCGYQAGQHPSLSTGLWLASVVSTSACAVALLILGERRPRTPYRFDVRHVDPEIFGEYDHAPTRKPD